MKRSEINGVVINAKSFFKNHKFILPPWADWNLRDWQKHKDYTGSIFQNQLGWDITDFGSGQFLKQGLLLFTIRNGNPKMNNKPYAEKIMIVEEEQVTPMHFHWHKMEDIINRGGGNLIIQLYHSTADDKLDEYKDIEVLIDGVRHNLKAGSEVRIKPGESICLEQGVYHKFYGEKGHGKVLVGEVSAVNDDTSDNCFLNETGRFPEIEEDAEPLHLLVSDYEKFLS